MLGQGVRPEGDSAFGLDEFLKTGGEDSKYRFMEEYFPSKDTVEKSLVDETLDIKQKYANAGLDISDDKALELAKEQTKGGLFGGMSLGQLAGLYGIGTLGLGFLIDQTTSDEDVGEKVDYAPHGKVYESILNPQLQYAQGGVLDLQGGGFSQGPGTGTSDSIPAMLSDGEFVMTADAVRGAGGGDRREGARRMYEAMDRLEARA